MLAIAFVIAFYVFAAILAGRGILQPRYGAFITHHITLNHTTVYSSASHSLNDSNSSPDGFLSSSYYSAAFKIGRSRNLSLILDTTSADILLAPSLYRPSPHSEDLYHGDTADISRDGNVSSTPVAYEATADHIGIDGLAVPAQPFANILSSNTSTNSLEALLPGNASGIMGLLAAQTQVNNASSWMRRVVDQHQLPSNRFGLLLQVPSSDTNAAAGELHLGGLDQDSYAGTLVATPLLAPATASVSAVLVGDDQDLAPHQTLVFASGTQAVYGPMQAVAALFNATGIEVQVEGSRLRGYYDCASAAKLGFRFPYNLASGDGGTTFYFESKALGREIGNVLCVAAIEGVDTMEDDTWVVGHSFMQGKYVDFNLEEQTVGIAYLKDKYV